MRKLLIAALAAVIAIAVAGVAFAANVYTVDGDTKPRAKGTAKQAGARVARLRVTRSRMTTPPTAASRSSSTASGPRVL